MIDARALLDDLRGLMPALEDDLRARAADEAEVDAALRALHATQRDAKRTADAFGPWRDAWVTQVAAAWLLSLVFVRYLEDNGLIPPRLAGSGERGEAADEYRQLYIRENPTHSDARFMRHVVFDELADLPGAREIFGPHNLAGRLAPSGDMATALLAFWRRQGGAGALVHDFDGMREDTRFLGDLYQDLSEYARKRFALLQTPDFVEAFILDYTLEPALETFGLEGFRLIDPTCGSGHFLLGAFGRLLDRWQRERPGDVIEDLTQKALDSVWGVDLNPFAVAIARFRLLLAALDACGVDRLAGAHGFRLNVTVADSLLAAPVQAHFFAELGERSYSAEDPAAVQRTFGQRYHAVVGNPPYIRPPDAMLNQEYRKLFKSCYRQYSLGVPFIEQFFALAVPGGYTGQITANSFMKREFGKALIRKVIRKKLDLTHVIDTAGAYIPGHGTPTVILFGRNQRPVGDRVRSALGIRGEPSTPTNPADGLVWRSIVENIDNPGFENEYISIVDAPRKRYDQDSWNLHGGGAAILKDALEAEAEGLLEDQVVDIGFGAVTRLDHVFVVGSAAARNGVAPEQIRPFTTGESLRDWTIGERDDVIWPYSPDTLAPKPTEAIEKFLWPWRRRLAERSAYGKTQIEHGLPWSAYSMYFANRFMTDLTLSYAFVSTHNHFVLDRGSKVFNRHAPVIKLGSDATEDDHLALLGLLNSSTACFWMKQVFQPKSHSTQRHHPDPARAAYEFASTGLLKLPIPGLRQLRPRIVKLARSLTQLSKERSSILDRDRLNDLKSTDRAKDWLETRWHKTDRLRDRMIWLQEELDWTCYVAFGLAKPALLCDSETDASCRRGDRPFERLRGRRSLVRRASSPVPLEEAEISSTTELPEHLEAVWKLRIQAIEESPSLHLLERLEFKRLWRDTEANMPEKEFRVQKDASDCRQWLLARLESTYEADSGTADTTSSIASRVATDARFLDVAAALAGREDFDLVELVTRLVLSEAVPALPPLRFKAAGLRKRRVWEKVWDLQRQEDAGRAVDIPKPPKYSSDDYRDTVSWQMRGPLDVPKERFNLYPYAARPGDRGVWVTWAGLDHLQRATALAGLYMQRREEDGWSAEQLTPFLAELDQLVPWLKQWHNEPDPAFDNLCLGDYYAEFVTGQIHELGLTLDAVRAWTPSKANHRKRGRKA